MKRILWLTLMMVYSLSIVAQEEESVKPLTDTEITRRVTLLDLEGKNYYNVVMTFKSTTPDYFITDKYKVKVTITDSSGKKVWKRTLKNAFLYVFSDGQVQIGKKNFDQILVKRVGKTETFIGIVREKEGVY